MVDTVSSVGTAGGSCSPPLPASSAGIAETTFSNNSRGAVQTSVGNIGSTSQQQQQQQPQQQYHHHHHHYHQQQQQQQQHYHHHHHHQHYPQTSAAATSTYSPPTTTPSSSSTSLGYSSGVPTATQTVSVPRQLAQWTKHQTLKLQVLSTQSIAHRDRSRSFLDLLASSLARSFARSLGRSSWLSLLRCSRVDRCSARWAFKRARPQPT